MSSVRREREPTFPEGYLSVESLDQGMAKTVCRVTPSAVPNFELVRRAVNEIYLSKDDILSNIEDVYNSGTDLEAGEWLQCMSDAMSIHAPTFSSIIETSMKDPLIFVNRNDYCNSQPPACHLDQSDHTKGQSEVSPHYSVAELTDQDLPHPGIGFFPTKVCTSYSVDERFAEPKIIQNYSYQDNHTSKAYGGVIQHCVTVPVEEHKHPLRYALKDFAASVFNVYNKGPGFTRVVYTATEALSVMYLTGLKPYCLLDDIILTDKHKKFRKQYDAWMTDAGKFNPLKVQGTVIFATGSPDGYLMMRERGLKQVVYYYPVVDTTRLLRDMNKACSYRAPRHDGSGRVTLSLWDKYHHVAEYTLSCTPHAGEYALTPYTSIALKLDLSPEKISLFKQEASCLHFLKVAIKNVGADEVCVPTLEFRPLWDANLCVRTIPSITPVDYHRKFVAWDGIPLMCHFQLRQGDIRLHIVDLVTRKQTTFRQSRDTIAGVLDVVLLCFKQERNICYAATLYDSNGTNWGLTKTVVDLMSYFKFFSTFSAAVGGTKAVFFDTFSSKKWYVPEDGYFAVLKGTWRSACSHDQESNDTIGLPLCHASAGATILHYFTPGFNDSADLDVVLGISDVSVSVDGVDIPVKN